MVTLAAVTMMICSAAATPSLPGTPIRGAGVSVGDPIAVENLTVFPIYGKDVDLGPMVSLEAALEKGQAVVREQGAQHPPARPRRARPMPQQLANQAPVQQARLAQESSGGATVGTLVIENKSKASIIVLAGTVVRGGKQDRQIGQDFVIGPKQTVPVDAFCVEHGRWSRTREGKNTGGKFEATAMLAPQKVRAAAQYEGNQSEVWQKVAEVNRDNKKSASSDTLMATYDDREIVTQRDAVSRRVTAGFDALDSAKATVGLAYAVTGKVRGARWFFAHEVFADNRAKLIGTAAVEAITAKARGQAGKATPRVSAGQVVAFIEELRSARVATRKKTKSLNENVYRKTDKGYNSEAIITKDGKAVPVTTDFLMH